MLDLCNLETFATSRNMLLILFNGLQVDDSPPGCVGRYRQLVPGAWVFARVLIYAFRSFPILWSPDSKDDPDETMYSYKTWVTELEEMDGHEGSWAVLARYLSQSQDRIDLSHEFVTDLCRAVVELVTRDAEIERNAYRARPLQLQECREKSEKKSQIDAGDEQAFMGKVRSAIGYKPRLKRIEKCVYRALVAVDVSIAHRIAKDAPEDCIVHQIVAQGRF